MPVARAAMGRREHQGPGTPSDFMAACPGAMHQNDWSRAESFAERAVNLLDDAFTRAACGTILINKADFFASQSDNRRQEFLQRGNKHFEVASLGPGDVAGGERHGVRRPGIVHADRRVASRAEADLQRPAPGPPIRPGTGLGPPSRRAVPPMEKPVGVGPPR